MPQVSVEQAISIAIEHHKAGRLPEAEQLYRQVLTLQPDHPNAMRLLGIVLMQNGQADQAVQLISRAIAINPTAAEYHLNLGNALAAAGNVDDAVQAYHQALCLQPNYRQAFYNIGVALAGNGKFDQAISAYRDALRIMPDYIEALNNLGAALQKNGQADEAIAALRKTLALKPDYADAWYDLGCALTQIGRLDEAESAYRQAIATGDLALAHGNLALLLLMQGRFQQGWVEYEWRWQSDNFPTPRRSFPQPQWSGGDLNGRTILLHAEQGFGDTIQFIRYAPLIARRGARVILECGAELAGLMKGVGGIDQIVAAAPLPAFDMHCPLPSLPLAFDTRLESIPSQVPYIQADADLIQAWGSRLRDACEALSQPGSMPIQQRSLKVGLVWAGRPTHLNDRQRSIAFSQLAELGNIEGVTFVSLQKGDAAAQAVARPPAMRWIDLTADLHDFADTAALIANLDLVISVDTAVAHLAGALGKPVWVLLTALPDWRWMLRRADSPWYPTVRLLRQSRLGDWDEVIARAAGELRQFLGCGRAVGQMTLEQHLQAALQHQQAGCLAEAFDACERALSLQPDHADALLLLGNLAPQTGRVEQALGAYRRALSRHAGITEDFVGSALADAVSGPASSGLGRTSRIPEHASAKADPTAKPGAAYAPVHIAELLNNYGNILLKQARYDEAIPAYRKAIELKPQLAEAHKNLGIALQEKGRLNEAIEAYNRAFALKPEPQTLNNLGNTLAKKGRIDEAIGTYRRAIALDPASYDVFSNLGVALASVGKLDEAIDAYRRAVALKPDFADAYSNLGVALAENERLERLDEAAAAFGAAIRLQPMSAQAHWNLALLLLFKGDFERGWEEYEWRWKRSDFTSRRRDFARPRWGGEDLNGRTILLHAEQGLGDAIQFVRYAPLIANRGGRVILQCPAELFRLFQTMEGVERVVSGERLPPFDLHCPLLSLPLAFGTRVASIPGKVPYLAADAALAEAWSRKLGASAGKLRVGLTWAGGTIHRGDRNRSIELSRFFPLAAGAGAGVRFYSLQKGHAAAQSSKPPAGMELIDLTADLHDFADTAALISKLDLVITVDTAVAHLAGAMGRPVWVLISSKPDWRWMPQRQDSPWYPTMRLFRQKRADDWAEVMQRVAEALCQQVPGENVTAQSGSTDSSVEACRNLTRDHPQSPEAHYRLGLACAANGQFDQAIAAHQQALQLKPDYPEAYSNLGNALTGAGRLDEAIAAYRRALQLRPDFPQACYNLANALGKMGQTADAIAAYQSAIRLKADYVLAHYNLGHILARTGRFDEAIAPYRRAVQLRPDYAEAHQNLGNALKEISHFDEAVDAYRSALRFKPDNPDVLHNLGIALTEMKQFDAAIAAYDDAIRLKPDWPDPHYNLAELLLLRGDYARGWKEYEWRRRRDDFPPVHGHFIQPQWDGRPVNGQTILLHTEQGFGDSIQFIRYAAMIAARGGRVILTCPPELARLFAGLANATLVDQEPLPHFDLHCPVMSLPLAFSTTLESIPADVPYLKADPSLCAEWRRKIDSSSGRLKVGLVWSGRPTHGNDARRSIAFPQFAPLAHVPGVTFYSLQTGKVAAAVSAPGALELVDFTAELLDFSDTAALISDLDLVITVDTAVAHLAGAMAKPVWLLLAFNPDWRWMLEREDSPWYPTMRLFRQKKPGDWEEVIGRVARALQMHGTP